MSKLLPTRLPIENEENVSSETFNRLVRVLELNLGEIDPLSTYSVNTENRDKQNFNPGTIIFNTSTNSLQLWDGFEFVNLTTPFTAKCILASMNSSLGSVTVVIS